MLKTINKKFQIAEWMERFSDNIFAYYDLPLPMGSDEIIKKLQMWLNNPWRGQKKQQFPIVLSPSWERPKMVLNVIFQDITNQIKHIGYIES